MRFSIASIAARYHKFITYLLVASLVFPGMGAAQDSQTRQSGRWPVKSVAVAGNTLGDPKLVLSMENNSIVARHKNREAFSIPAASVVDLLYDDVAHRMAAEAWSSAAQGCQSGGCNGDPVATMYLIGLLTFTPLLDAFKTHHHLIHILWQSNGRSQTEVVEAGNSEYKSLMVALEGLTGKKFKNLPAERKKLSEELSRSMDKGLPLYLDREAVVDNRGLEAGSYKTVLLDRGSGRGELYFFASQAKPSLQFLASTPVVMENEQNALSSAEAIYAQQGGVTTIVEFRLPNQLLHLPSPFIPPEAYESVRSFYAGDQLWAHVGYEEYKGEPAFRFPVVDAGGTYDRSGFLYVTRNDIAYQSTDKKAKESFRIIRTNSHAVIHAADRRHSTPVIQVSVRKKTLYFAPFYGANPFTLPGPAGKRLLSAGTGFGQFFMETVNNFDVVENEFEHRTN